MIIGYDFFLIDDIDSDKVVNFADIDDEMTFDTCSPLPMAMQNIEIKNANYDELEILQNATENIKTTDKNKGWSNDTVIFAKFQDNLSAGSINVDSYNIYSLQFLKRKKGTTEWQICKNVAYKKDKKIYEFIDKYIESQQTYQYTIRPIAKKYDETGLSTGIVVGESIPQSKDTEIDVVFDYAHLFDNETSYDLLYNFKLGDINSNIDANTITTLSGQYPFVIYGASRYKAGSVSCLLVTEESAIGSIDVWAEKKLRNSIDKFLSNKKPKILKYEDGTYLLISISDNYTLIPDENLLGSYSLSFNYTEIGDANDVDTLKKYGLWSDV